MGHEFSGLKRPRGGRAPSKVATPNQLQDFTEAEINKGYREEPLPCGRCGGSGRYAYNSINGSVCFGCNGQGRVIGRLYTPEKRRELDDKNQQRKDRADEKLRQQRQQAKIDSLRRFPDAHKISAEILDMIEAEGREAVDDKYGSFILDVATKGEQYGYTDRQAEALVSAYNKRLEIVEKREAEAAVMIAAPDGRQTISGEVVYVTLRETQYGQTWKMVVLDDRMFKVWSTVPKAIVSEMNMPLEETLKGKHVTFDATLKVSDKDESFAFASRPGKASVEIPVS